MQSFVHLDVIGDGDGDVIGCVRNIFIWGIDLIHGFGHNQDMETNLIAVLGGFEYWQLGGEVYRVAVGQRGYMLPEGVPANVRWECGIEHFRRFIAPVAA